jgi:hypothetical protein
MTLLNAHKFIVKVESAEIKIPENCILLEDLFLIAQKNGFTFSFEELQKAFEQNYNFKKVKQKFALKKT